MHEGHRERMLERMKTAGDSFQDHELLEFLLFYSIPRKNTNPIAHNLLNAFGSLSGVFEASCEQLKAVEGVGDRTAGFLRSVAITIDRLRYSSAEFPVKFSLSAYGDFLVDRFHGLPDEVVEIYCLDTAERVRQTKRFTSLSDNYVLVKIEEVSRFIASQSPYGVVVAHNHPNKKCVPSKEDDVFTKQFMMICSVNNTKFCDHIIVGTDGIYSYFRAGILDEVKRDYSISNLVKESS